MAKGFRKKDASQIAFIRKLAKYRHCCTPHSKGEVYSIAEIHAQRDSIDYQEYPTT
jgi:hypothetical protein